MYGAAAASPFTAAVLWERGSVSFADPRHFQEVLWTSGS